MQNKIKRIHQKPDLHFSICSSSKELYSKFERELRRRGLVGFSDLQGNMHYIVDGRLGFSAAYRSVESKTLRLMESRFDDSQKRLENYEAVADYLIKKYDFDDGLIGTNFIRYVIVHCLLDKSLLLSLSNHLYPAIAKQFGSRPDKVCYCIRYALKKLFLQEEMERQEGIEKEYFFEAKDTNRNNRSVLTRLVKLAEDLVKGGQIQDLKNKPH